MAATVNQPATGVTGPPAAKPPAVKPAAKPSAPKPSKPFDVATATPQELAAEAARQIAEQMKTAQQPLIDEQARQDALNAQHGQAIQGFTTALATLLGNIAPQVSAPYEQAAGNQAAFAHGFSDKIQGEIGANNQSNNDFLAQMGAPASAQHAAPDVGSVTYGLGGFIPAETMSREGAAFGSAAALAPRVAASQGLEDFTANQYAGTDAHQKIAQSIAELAAKQPELVRQALMDLENLQFKAKSDTRAAQTQAFNEWATTQRLKQGAASLNLRTAKAKFDEWATSQGINIRWDNLTLSQQRATVAQANAAASQANAAANTALRGQTVQQGWQRLTASEQARERKAASGGFSAKQMQTYKGQSLTLADRAKQGVTVDAAGKFLHLGAPVNGDPKGSKGHPALSFQDALREGRKAGIPLSVLVPILGQVYGPGHQYEVTPRGLVPKGEAAQGAAVKGATAKDAAVVKLAQEFLGTPYSWGGGNTSGPSRGTGRGANIVGFDCSAFIQYVWGKSGVSIPRTTYDQWKQGTAVAKNQLRPGDAVFFHAGPNGPEHVGMYLGNGRFIESPHTGATIRISNLAGRSDYMGARRYA